MHNAQPGTEGGSHKGRVSVCMYKRVIRAAKYVYCIYKVHKWVHERASGRSEEARQRLEA